MRWAETKLAEYAPPPEVEELLTDKQFKSTCEESQLCIISALPHILDCQSKCRNEYIETLKKVAERFKKNKWAYLWMQAGDQPDLEQALEIGGFGYPALAVLNVRKMKFSIMRGSFSYEGISEFLRDLAYGKGSSAPIRGAEIPKINKVDGWDGKDAEVRK